MAKDQISRKSDGSINLRVDLKKDIADLFYKIQSDKKFSYRAEVIRYCIIEASKQTEFQLDPSYWNKINRYMNYDFVKKDQGIYSTQIFINKALDFFFNYIDREIDSILSFDVRLELNEEENEIALAIIECQSESIAEQVTIEEIAKKLNMRNLTNIEKILNKFVERGILSRKITQELVYYHAKSIKKI
ncbi:MAG: hypothetical protein OEY49_03105 [Candidatus Heimdallarchaeota archaeon]|nr:hypothetical protein [Candidatus Heimdallarchaeota archaeon]